MKVRLGLLLLAAAVLAVAGYLSARAKYPPVEGWSVEASPHPAFDTLDPWIRDAFVEPSDAMTERYANLFQYLLAGFVAYRTDSGARSHYPGAASVHGRQVDGLEGFSRIAPLIGAWLAGGRARTVQLPAFGDVDLLDLLRSGLAAGTDPESRAYWGDIGLLEQRVVEAADIALAVWLTRDVLWATLDADAQARLVRWLRQTEGKARSSRFVNWHLFPMLVNRTLKSLGEPVSEAAFESDWAAVKASYAGDGWFRDSAADGFDYYNAWAFHYGLYWLARIGGMPDAAFVDEARTEFVRFYRHLITPRGFPILGRSICYRTAAPVPLIIAALAEPETISPGEAQRALDVTWRYFVRNGALADGVLTQGYCGADLRVLDQYSGPASCLWGARSLVIAFSQPDDAPLWTSVERRLPVEQEDFSITQTTLGWRVEGNRADGSVVIHRLGETDNPPLRPISMKQRIASVLLHRPFRGNHAAKYDRATYSSHRPFCGCLRTTTIAREMPRQPPGAGQ